MQSEARDIEARANAIALEQSVELPRELAVKAGVEGMVGKVRDIRELAPGRFDVKIALLDMLICGDGRQCDAGQLLNVLFGNSSLHEDVRLNDVEFPQTMLAAFGGPHVGLAGLRAQTGAHGRALTASALKPQGLGAPQLARIAHELALGGLDIVKDDHGLANQSYSPFNERVAECAQAVERAQRSTGLVTLYAPSLWGSLDDVRAQVRTLRSHGLKIALISPMVVGLPTFQTIAREAHDIAFLAHPAMAGAAQIAPPLLLGKIFRLLGASATIFPNYGGRFSYSKATCEAIASCAREPWAGLKASAPMPAGGMTLERVPEMLDTYGQDTILLIGGALLGDTAGITNAARAFATKVSQHGRS